MRIIFYSMQREKVLTIYDVMGAVLNLQELVIYDWYVNVSK